MKTEKKELRTAQVTELCRRRLLNYADSFYELAKNYDREFQPENYADRQAVLSERRLWENRQILRGHLNEMAKIMAEVACEVLCYRPMEDKKEKMLIRAMREEGICVEAPCYITKESGQEAVAVTLSVVKGPGTAAENVADMFSVLLNRRLKPSANSPLLVDKTPRCFVLEEEAQFLSLTGFAKAIKENETVSGDNYAVLETESGRVTVILSDGTGSGEKAGKDSEKVLDLTEKFLEAGYSICAAVQMINLALYALSEDCNHPTLDICDINLREGSCEILKVGGAASFLKREEEVELLREGSLPLGVFQQLRAEPIRRELRDGDYIVMVSDGVIDAFGEQSYEDAVCGVLAGMRERNPGEMADKILRMALLAGGGRIYDDMTVGVIGVWETGMS